MLGDQRGVGGRSGAGERGRGRWNMWRVAVLMGFRQSASIPDHLLLLLLLLVFHARDCEDWLGIRWRCAWGWYCT